MTAEEVDLFRKERFRAKGESITISKNEDAVSDDGGGESVVFMHRLLVDSTNPDSGYEIVEEEWSIDHAKLLYMLSKFAKCALHATDVESWMRQIPLYVLLYEAISAGVLDYDYAPSSQLISANGGSRRVWMNISQEGKGAIDDLRERDLINGLKLSTEDFQPVTAFQVSKRGVDCLHQLSQELRDQVDAFIYSPGSGKTELLQITLLSAEDIKSLKAGGRIIMPGASGEDDEDDSDGDIGKFCLKGDKGYLRVSEVTDTEDVSYVSSPYLPTCVRNPRDQKTFTSNKHRAHESAKGVTNIKDTLDEVIVLSRVVCLVGEWIPFGANQIVALNERLGALDRCQGGLFSAMVDMSPTDTSFQVAPGLTDVTILDYDFVHYINFEAEINFPEEEGIVQVENFGIHLNVDGTVLYGIKIEAIMDRLADHISLDHLSRLLVDVHQDSSKIMDDLLSNYQRSLLDMIFMGDVGNRGKFNMIIADGIEPFLPAEEYLDREDNENELKQVLGDMHNAYDIGDDGVLIIGRNGVLVAGANAHDYEQLLMVYLSLLCREMFIRNFFTRTFILDDLLKKIRKLIMEYHTNPSHVPNIRLMLNGGSKDIILLKEILHYLDESVLDMALPEMPDAPAGAILYRLLSVESQLHDVVLRTKDLQKLVHGATHELKNLQQMTEVINTKQLEDVFKNVEANTKYLVDASAANQRASASLEVMQVILAGSFAFDIVDRLSGGTLNITVPDWVYIILVDPIIRIPMLWFFVNMMWLFLVSVCLTKLMRYLGEKANGALTLRVKVNRKIDVPKLKLYLSTKKIEVADSVAEPLLESRKSTWVETDSVRWRGEPPKIEIQFDQTYGFLLVCLFQVNARNSNLSENELLDVFFTDLMAHEVLLSKDGRALKPGDDPDKVVTSLSDGKAV